MDIVRKYILTVESGHEYRERHPVVAKGMLEAADIWLDEHPNSEVVSIAEYRYEICQVCHQKMVRRLTYDDVCVNVTCSEYWGKDTS